MPPCNLLVTSIGCATGIPPPPPLPSDIYPYSTLDSASEDSVNAAAAGYKLHQSTEPVAGTGSKRILTYIAEACMLLIVAGIPLYHYISAGMGGIKTTDPIVSEEYKYKVSFPEDWKTVKNPRKKTGHSDAVGFFFKGATRNPDIKSVIYLSEKPPGAPEYFTLEMLGHNESHLTMINKAYMASMGMEYELLELKIFRINDSQAIWMDGNGTCKNCDPKRDFTFIVFTETNLYWIKFMFEEKNVDAYWPEIEGILESIEFFDSD